MTITEKQLFLLVFRSPVWKFQTSSEGNFIVLLAHQGAPICTVVKQKDRSSIVPFLVRCSLFLHRLVLLNHAAHKRGS